MTNQQHCRIIPPTDSALSYNAAIAECARNARKPAHGLLATGTHSKLWKNFRTLSVCFLDELSNEDKQEFKRIIWKWAVLTNLNIVFVNNISATIRIKTDTLDCRSTTGTDALLITAGEPTIYIGVKPGDELFQRTVLHEFGHVLGLEHEHLHPEANIPWNRAKVYAHYTELGWSRQEIEQNLLDVLEDDGLVITDYDQFSIMHYPIDKALTDGTFQVGLNQVLSEDDMRMVKSLYPETPSDLPDDPSYRP